MIPDVVTALGIMSGSSGDGLDLAIVEFEGLEEFLNRHSSIKWSIKEHETVAFPREVKSVLKDLSKTSLQSFLTARTQFDHWICNTVDTFLQNSMETPQYIALHGHTILHRPGEGVSLQIPDGQRLSAETELAVLTDFRQCDTALDGQGTPLAPVADRDLFPAYDSWINIGGIANISFQKNGKWTAFDICPANQLLNHLARQTGRPLDRDGALARSGSLIPDLLETLNALEYYQTPPPRSLGNEQISEKYIPLLNTDKYSPRDLLHTTTLHISQQIQKAVRIASGGDTKVLITGGGAHNGYLMECLRKFSEDNQHYTVPDRQIADYKECLLIAWAGLLRLCGRPNLLSSVTGAKRSTSGGAIYDPNGTFALWMRNNR